VTTWVYVDESKRTGYVLAAATVPDPEATHRVIHSLILPGQRRLHMHNEQVRRRRAIVSALATTQVTITIYDAARQYRTDSEGRAACLATLVKDLATVGGNGDNIQLVIEQDDSLVRSDRHELYQLVRAAGLTDVLKHRHQRAHEEPLLALPDIAAWCWVRSGFSPILGRVRTV